MLCYFSRETYLSAHVVVAVCNKYLFLIIDISPTSLSPSPIQNNNTLRAKHDNFCLGFAVTSAQTLKHAA